MMDCKDCRALIPGYVDQELSEVQSGPLRQHLMDCQDCRKSLAGQKSLERWFASPAAEQAEVPTGFARRVARRAFAGDLGRVGSELPGIETLQAQRVAQLNGAPIYTFVLWATAAAAGLLLVVSGMLFQEVQLGAGNNLHAVPREPSKDELLKRMDDLADPAYTGPADAEAGTGLEDMSDVKTKKTDKDQIQSEQR